MEQSASLFWPTDRSWCVATEVDFDSTLVGGSSAVIERLLDILAFEAYEVGMLDDRSAFGDHVNARWPLARTPSWVLRPA